VSPTGSGGHYGFAEQEQDRRWFAANPGRRIYVRPARGWETSQGDDLTVVAQVSEGVRIRAPFRVHPLVNWSRLNQSEDELRDALGASPMGVAIRAAVGD